MADIEEWGVDEVCQYLEEKNLGEFVPQFRDHGIQGNRFQNFTADDLEEMGIKAIDDHRKILSSIAKIRPPSKVFNDPIHGHVELHPLLVKIIDTPQFQRLRNLKQLGGGYFVYPGASHNRFEHSIGSCHLAGQLVEALRSRQPELGITKRDVLCVQIAGLCHDLGHGPFSHLYDGMFITEVCRNNEELKARTHEKLTTKMLDFLVEDNNLKAEMKEYGLEPDQDLKFIAEMIVGEDKIDKRPWKYEGRTEEKSFLYEVVSNKTNGIDVDKFDYLARDCYHLGLPNSFDYRRFLKYARVCEVNNIKHICTRDKMVDNIYDLFHTRYCVHRRVCFHRVTNIIQIMIKDAFVKADKHLKFRCKDGDRTLSTAIENMEAYTKLTDSVFQEILNSTNQELDEAKEILQRILSRNLYKFLGQKEIMQGHQMDEEDRKSELERQKEQRKWTLTENLPESLRKEDFDVAPINLDYGMGEKNPFEQIYFYSKEDNTKASRIPRELEPKLVTHDFSENVIRFYFKGTDRNDKKKAQAHFNNVFSNSYQLQLDKCTI